MKNLTPHQISIRASLVIAVAYTLLSWVSLSNPTKLVIVFHFGLVFVISFLVMRYTIGHFIYRKIKLIYKTIQKEKSKKLEKKEETSSIIHEDLMARVNMDVQAWADSQRQEIDRLVADEQYRKEFLGNVSHELKTPIFNIQGYILTLLEGGLEDESINRDYLQRADKSVDRLIHIVEDLETISQLEAGHLELDMDKFDVVALTRDILKSQELVARDSSITLGFKDHDEKPREAMADKERIRQVITNLIVNSIRYGKKGGQTEVRFYDMDENWLVEISDDGIGIPKKHLPRIFERFFRVDKSRSRERGGTGLGLSIVKHIIEAHGQTINVRSTEGVGSTFSFTLEKAKERPSNQRFRKTSTSPS
ncbi:MAG: sensor histidine kinase [Flavobacteriales bacterium]|nr:sensor histidine kinase [Flavobacteriales bacterium]